MAAQQLSGGPSSIALVDISYIWKRNWLGMPRDASPGDAAQKTLHDLAGIRESVEHVIICCDAPPYWRKQILESYKSSREPPSESELSQKRWVMDRLDKEGYSIAKCKSFEAEDVMATLVAAYGFWCKDVRLVASDKDVACLVTETVKMHVPPSGQRSGEIRGPKEINAKYGVGPKDMPLWLALCGDDSDDIPGIPGVGPKNAAKVIAQCGNLAGIKQALATVDEGEKPSAVWKAIGLHFDVLERALKLVELRVDVPIDVAALLEKKPRQTIVKPDAMRSDDGVPDADFIPISRAPEGVPAPPWPSPVSPGYVVTPMTKPMPKGAEASGKSAAQPMPASSVQDAAPPSAPQAPKAQPAPAAITRYGRVSDELQPLDLDAAKNMSLWLCESRMFGKFPTPEAVFAVMLRGRELGIGATASLMGFHVIEGRPAASADLIRSLAERDPHCKYFRLVDSTAESATWETHHNAHPEPTRYTYTLAEARLAGLTSGNWQKRPRDMIAKTAGSKLARLVYPDVVSGLYAHEEME